MCVFLLFRVVVGTKHMTKYAIIGIATGTVLYFIDGNMAYVNDDYLNDKIYMII